MKIIGKTDKADFPELGLTDIDVKIDTGAYTSSIHCHHIKEVVLKGQSYVEFEVLDPSHPEYIDKVFRTKRYNKKKVKNSGGRSEQRFFVETNIVMFGEEYPIALSLSERGEMKFPVLLGRKLLNRRFMVDTSKKNLSHKLKLNK